MEELWGALLLVAATWLGVVVVFGGIYLIHNVV